MGQGPLAINYQTTAFTEEDMNEMNKKFKMVTLKEPHVCSVVETNGCRKKIA
jgi:hypothetical protein